MDSSANEVNKERKAETIKLFEVPIENGIKSVNEVKGQSISKGHFSVFKSTKQTNEIFCKEVRGKKKWGTLLC